MAVEVPMTHKRKLSEDDEQDGRSRKVLKTSLTEASTNNEKPETPDLKIPTPANTDSGYGSVKTSPTKHPVSNASSTAATDEWGTPLVVNRVPNAEVKKRSLFVFGPGHLKKYLQRHFIRFKDEVDPKEIANYLLVDGVISIRDLEDISEANGRRQKVDILIKSIVKSKVINDVQTTRKVLDAFAKTGREDLFNRFEDDIPDDVKLPASIQRKFHEKHVNSIIRKHLSLLKEEIDPLSVIDSLLERKVIGFDEHQNIMTIDFKKKKMVCLCKYILDKPPFAFWEFCRVLKEEPSYADIGRRLLKDEVGAISDQPSTEEMDLQLTDPFTISTTDMPNTDDSCAEIHINLCSKKFEKMVVEDYEASGPNNDLSPKAMEIGYDLDSVSFSSIKIKLRCLTEQSHLNLMRRSEHSLMCIEQIFKTLITREHLQKMKEEQVKHVDVTLCIYPPQTGKAKCLCKLRKEDVVKHFTLIEERLKCVGEMVVAISESPLVAKKDKNKWLENKNNVDAFLRLILNGQDNLVCMLEMLLRTTGQNKLLTTITDRDETNATLEISLEDIRQQKNIIFDEIEPRKFVDMLRGIPESDVVIENVMAKELSRLKRCEALVTFVLKTKSVKHFQQELERQKMFYLINLLKSKRGSANSLDYKQMKEALIAKIGDISENIEPFRFKTYLVKKPEMTGEDFQTICKHTTRKRRVFALMEKIIHGPDILIERFINGLDQLHYHGLSKLIKERAEQYKECPRLHEATLKGKTVVFEGSYRINYTTCDANSETQLDVDLNLQNMMSDHSEDNKKCVVENNDKTIIDPLKDARISAWVLQHQGFMCMEMEEDQQTTEVLQSSAAEESIDPSPIITHSPPCALPDETLTTSSSQAPTTNVSSPLSSQYEDITPPSSPVRFKPATARTYKRTNSLMLDEESSSRSSGSSGGNRYHLISSLTMRLWDCAMQPMKMIKKRSLDVIW